MESFYVFYLISKNIRTGRSLDLKKTHQQGHIKGMLPLSTFIVLYMLTGILTGNFESMPLMIGIFIAIMVAFVMNNQENKKSFDEKMMIFSKGAGDPNLMLLIVIFMLAGAFYATTGEMGAVDSISNLGLSILPESMLLPGLFVITSVLSFSMGTSMGTIPALIPIAVDIAQKTDTNIALLAGIVVGGAMFGDNLSFIADTSIAATRTQNVSMKEKFVENFWFVLPAIVLNLILLAIQPFSTMGLETRTYSYQLIEILPYVLVITLAIIGLNAISVLALGILSGFVIGMFNGSFTLITFMSTIHGGMMEMQDMAIIALLVGGLVALMDWLGGIEWLLHNLTSRTKTKRSAEFSIAALVSLLDIATTNNSISILTAGPLARDIADEYGISRARTATILDTFAAGFNGLLPYAGQLLVAGGLAGVSPVRIMVYNWYSMLMIGVGLVSILFQFPRSSRENTQTK